MSALLYDNNLKTGSSPQDALQQILDISANHVMMNPPLINHIVKLWRLILKFGMKPPVENLI